MPNSERNWMHHRRSSKQSLAFGIRQSASFTPSNKLYLISLFKSAKKKKKSDCVSYWRVYMDDAESSASTNAIRTTHAPDDKPLGVSELRNTESNLVDSV